MLRKKRWSYAQEKTVVSLEHSPSSVNSKMGYKQFLVIYHDDRLENLKSLAENLTLKLSALCSDLICCHWTGMVSGSVQLPVM